MLEAAIYATRLHLLPRAFHRDELARLQMIVDKTAGPHEIEAMALLADYIRSAPVVPGGVVRREADTYIPVGRASALTIGEITDVSA